MNCTDLQTKIDDYLDGELSPEMQKAFTSHIDRCVSCQQSFEQIKALSHALKTLPVVEASPDFEARVFGEVRRQHAGRSDAVHFGNRFTTGFATAMAAGLALWFVSTVFFPQLDVKQPHAITVSLDQVRTVRLMFEAPADLDHVTLSVILPQNIELDGFAGQKQLVWQTSLKKGENILALPVTAIADGQGELIAELNYGEKTKQFRVVLKTVNNGALLYQLKKLKTV